MASTESTPLLPSASKKDAVPPAPLKRQRTVTFSPTVSTSNAAHTSTSSTPTSATSESANPVQSESSGQPLLSALNSKIRRRHSHGSPLPLPVPPPKAGAQRTTRTAEKLKLLPNPDHSGDEESGRDVYAQFTRIKDPTARRDAARLGKEDRQRLPRVTAYCTANAYRLEELMKFFKGRGKTKGAVPKLFDECLYTPYSYGKSLNEGESSVMPTNLTKRARRRRFSDSAVEADYSLEERRDEFQDLDASAGGARFQDLHTSAGDASLDDRDGEAPNHTAEDTQQPQEQDAETLDFDTEVHTPEVFLFNYGTVVIWGMTVLEEQRFLKELAKFETEKLAKDDVQTENFNFYYTREYQARIYNDFISLKEKKNYMTKLAISHALSQSVKTSLYEDLVDNTIETTKEFPSTIATTGKVNLSRKEINMQIGDLFILRINIHLQGSVLDSPELMWAEPQLEPIYQAVRSYLEMDQRVQLLTERLEVIADLLAVLKDQLTSTHGEFLEWIVIVLIALEILVAAINIAVDLYAGVE